MTSASGSARQGLAGRYNNGMVESPRPRRFQFRLLTLLVFVSLFCVICGWAFHQVRIVQERKSLLEHVIAREGFYVTGGMQVRANRDVRWSDLYSSLAPATARPTVPLFRRWLGDEAIGVIGVPGGLPHFAEIKSAFPEAAFSILTVKD
jgi:hypothetical protein